MNNIFLILGGFGLFLYGMKMMSDGLSNLAGDRMRSFLERTTSNRFKGIGVGALVTSIVQSSTATTVLVVGFVNSHIMTLTQAIAVIMGANIGTTLSAHMLSFRLDVFAPLIIFIGLMMYMFFKKKNIKKLGFCLLGVGILFFGITVMGSPLKEFSEMDGFQSMLTTFQNPFLAILAGFILTAIIQSSTATNSIVIAMYISGVDLPFETAAFIVLGSAAGTSTTALLVSIAGTRESKRAALAHTLFNVIGCVVFGLLIFSFPNILTLLQETWRDPARQVAMFQTFYSVLTALLLVGFVKHLAWIVKKIIPDDPNEKDIDVQKLVYLKAEVLENPPLAVARAHKEICRMGNLAYENLQLSIDSFHSKDIKKAEQVFENEELINYLNHEIPKWLIRIRMLDLSEEDMEFVRMMLRTVSNIERIGDRAENIAEYAILRINDDMELNDAAINELYELGTIGLESLKLALELYKERDSSRIEQVSSLEERLNTMTKRYVENHLQRIKKGECDHRNGAVFTDMANDIERCSDYAEVIANSFPIYELEKHFEQETAIA